MARKDRLRRLRWDSRRGLRCRRYSSASTSREPTRRWRRGSREHAVFPLWTMSRGLSREKALRRSPEGLRTVSRRALGGPRGTQSASRHRRHRRSFSPGKGAMDEEEGVGPSEWEIGRSTTLGRRHVGWGCGSIWLSPCRGAGDESLTPAQCNYSTTDQELLAIINVHQTFEQKLLGVKFTIITNYMALRTLMTQTVRNQRRIRWLKTKTMFNFDI